MKKPSVARTRRSRSQMQKTSRWIFGEPSSFLNGVLVGYTAVTFVLVLLYGLIRLTSDLFAGF